MHLFLARHAKQGRGYDPPLTARGVVQADDLAAWAATFVRPDRLFSSSLRRCKQTAGAVSEAVGIEYEPDHRIREFGTCLPDGGTFSAAEMPDYPKESVAPSSDDPIAEGLESWNQFRQRVRSFLDSLLSPGSADQRNLVVTHSGVIHAVFEELCHLPPGGGVHTGMAHAGVTYWEHDSGASSGPPWRLHNHNLVTTSSGRRLLGSAQGECRQGR